MTSGTTRDVDFELMDAVATHLAAIHRRPPSTQQLLSRAQAQRLSFQHGEASEAQLVENARLIIRLEDKNQRARARSCSTAVLADRPAGQAAESCDVTDTKKAAGRPPE